MARIGKVFPDLVRDLELKGELGTLSIGPEVVGVILLDSLPDFTVAPISPARFPDWFTQGEQLAPAAGVILADTGPLPLGVYDIDIVSNSSEPARIAFQWRNFDNTGNLIEHRFRQADATFFHYLRLRTLVADERFRLLTVIAGVLGSAYQSSLLVRVSV